MLSPSSWLFFKKNRTMKKILTLILLAITLNTAAQVKTIPLYSEKVEIRGTYGIAFLADNYSYEYFEAQRADVAARVLIGPLFLGAGASYTFPTWGRDNQTVSIQGQIGYKLIVSRITFDFYGSLEKAVSSKEPIPFMSGFGISFSVRLVGPLHITSDLKTQYPIFMRSYSYYPRKVSGLAAVGIALKF